MQKIYHRWQQPILEKALKSRRVLLLSGPRQCGKTTLARQLLSKDVIYLTLDDYTLREAAKSDPQEFVQTNHNLVIIDEIQRVPELIPAIKKVVDQDNRPGQYLLTGSADIQSLPTTMESLAGRVHKIRLRPLTQGEILGKNPLFLERAFSESFPKLTVIHDRKQILEMAFRGGFPEAVRLPAEERKSWYLDYVLALIERDLKDIAKITRQESMRQLVHTLAAWSSKIMDISGISSGLAIQRPTIESYINALEALYLIERISPWTHTDYGRVGKKAKLFMSDCGLLRSILNWTFEQIRLDSDRSGKIIETFMMNEISAQIEANPNKYALFHYRDREQREIDFLIEREEGALLGIEVKASSSASMKDFQVLKWFKETVAKDHPFIGIVLYTGEHVASFGSNLWAVPMSMLWH